MQPKGLAEPTDWMTTGVRDEQTVTADWLPVQGPSIAGVVLKEIRPVVTSTGHLTEILRTEWNLDGLPVSQIFQRTLDPGSVSGWHAHAETTDRLFCSVGSIRLSLYDGRRSSPSFGKLWHAMMGERRPLLVVIPPGIWHGVKALGTSIALIINIVDRAYGYEDPDHWRLPADTEHIPFKLV